MHRGTVKQSREREVTGRREVREEEAVWEREERVNQGEEDGGGCSRNDTGKYHNTGGDMRG